MKKPADAVCVTGITDRGNSIGGWTEFGNRDASHLRMVTNCVYIWQDIRYQHTLNKKQFRINQHNNIIIYYGKINIRSWERTTSVSSSFHALFAPTDRRSEQTTDQTTDRPTDRPTNGRKGRVIRGHRIIALKTKAIDRPEQSTEQIKQPANRRTWGL